MLTLRLRPSPDRFEDFLPVGVRVRFGSVGLWPEVKPAAGFAIVWIWFFMPECPLSLRDCPSA